jgi:predicted membrane protein
LAARAVAAAVAVIFRRRYSLRDRYYAVEFRCDSVLLCGSSWFYKLVSTMFVIFFPVAAAFVAVHVRRENERKKTHRVNLDLEKSEIEKFSASSATFITIDNNYSPVT